MVDPIPYWLVYSPTGSRPPSFQHATEESAQAEAERLAADNPGREFYVLEPRYCVVVGLTRRHRFGAGDEVPF